MSLPLFVSSTGRAHIEQVVVVLLVLIPLWVVLANRIRLGSWTQVPDEVRNGAWKPRELETQPETTAVPQQTFISPSVLRALPVLGIAGLVLWIVASQFHQDAPPIQISRSEAEQKARQALNDRGTQLDSNWTVLSHVQGQPGEENRFVWQKAGRDRYERLLGLYVTPPNWSVRFARFQGDVAERAEEYHV